jgi:hypothetical protein
MKHVHRMRPLWLLPTSPAWNDGWYQVVTHARCSVCGAEAVLAGWQHRDKERVVVTQEGEIDAPERE